MICVRILRIETDSLAVVLQRPGVLLCQSENPRPGTIGHSVPGAETNRLAKVLERALVLLLVRTFDAAFVEDVGLESGVRALIERGHRRHW